ncbi:MAG: thiosulfate oxidation carrier complex protein SoxZ [Acidovorax sp.]|nr:thiosulfate oxidation carrier complex protein SoxZ [Acidovorax sp.]
MATKPLRLQLQRKNEQMELIVRIPQRTGGRATEVATAPPKERFLRSVSVQLNGKPVVDAQVGPSVADNPRFGFMFANVQVGDKFTVLCRDDAGEEMTGEIVAEA